MKPRAAWFIPVPLAVASWMGAHCLAYWLVAPGGEQHMGMHAEGSHSYLGYTPAIALWALALILGGLLLCAREGMRGRRPSPPPVHLFMLLPPIGFTLQEHLERLIGTGGIPPDIVLEPTFLAGLALQLPFAIAALLVAHALNAVGFEIGRTLAPRLGLGGPTRAARAAPLLFPALAKLIRPSVLALGHGPRAPPAAASP
jgi:hypothetical protein